jgi:hypothetical protein
MSQSDYVPRMFPISIKGVVVRDGKVLLLKNDRTSGSYQAVGSNSARPPRSASCGRSPRRPSGR